MLVLDNIDFLSIWSTTHHIIKDPLVMSIVLFKLFQTFNFCRPTGLFLLALESETTLILRLFKSYKRADLCLSDEKLCSRFRLEQSLWLLGSL